MKRRYVEKMKNLPYFFINFLNSTPHMKTLLIPVDFTAASKNAIDFAAKWSIKYNYERIILLRSFYISMYESVIMGGEFANVDQDYLTNSRTQEKEQLNNLCKELDEKTGANIKVQSAITELPLLRSVVHIVKAEQPAMVLLGIDNSNYSNESLISGNVISIAKISPVRLLIVPKDYVYTPVKKALVPCNFSAIEKLNKLNHLHSSPQWQDVQLMVLNVDPKKRYLNPDQKFIETEKSLHAYLKNFNHRIYYADDSNVINGILYFEKINEVQLIIALPGESSFLYSLTHKNISEAIYRNSKLPVMILK
jgi:nucleotide-binding universal stress UspA family protein